jgi:NADH:ubiquinone oxidoreductase subunit 6 (subunit J)
MIVLVAIAAFTLATASVAVALRNLIHSALLLVASWAGIAVFYLWAGAEFVAFAQLLVYVGAISMVVLFAVLLTRQSRSDPTRAPATTRRASAAVLAGMAIFGVLAVAVMGTPIASGPTKAPELTVRQLGIQMMDSHAAALLVIGVILTVSLLGAIVLASSDNSKSGGTP